MNLPIVPVTFDIKPPNPFKAPAPLATSVAALAPIPKKPLTLSISPFIGLINSAITLKILISPNDFINPLNPPKALKSMGNFIINFDIATPIGPK